MRTPVYFVIQSSYSQKQLRGHGMRSLGADFVAVSLPKLEVEASAYSVLDWQKKVLQVICEKYMQIIIN